MAASKMARGRRSPAPRRQFDAHDGSSGAPGQIQAARVARAARVRRLRGASPLARFVAQRCGKLLGLHGALLDPSTEKAKMAPRVIELHTELEFASGDAQRQVRQPSPPRARPCVPACGRRMPPRCGAPESSGMPLPQDDVVEVLVQLGLNDRRAIDRFLPKAFGFAVLVLLALILVASSAGLAARLIGGLLVGVESCALACSAQDVAGARCVPVACPVAVPAFLSLLGRCNVPPVRVVPSTARRMSRAVGSGSRKCLTRVR